MIKYQLKCDHDHLFDGWFPSIKEFERQQAKQLIVCPTCDSATVDRAVMSPRIGKSKKKTISKEDILNKKEEKYRQQFTDNTMMTANRAKDVLRKMKQLIISEYENVGDKFAEEVRKAEKGERDDRIYGTATTKEVNELLDDGIDLFHVPDVKDDA